MRLKSVVLKFMLHIFVLVLFCEYILYFLTLAKCNWPKLDINENAVKPLNAMIIADTHLLGPFRGHWLDKMRREWQMKRTFQTAMTMFQPDTIFVLGDLFDEGNWVNRNGFEEYAQRFRTIFKTPEHVKLFGIVGNHDIGFHYSIHPTLVNRFDAEFNTTGVQLVTINDIHFVIINSIAMEGDGCYFCKTAENQIHVLADQLKCNQNNDCTTQNRLNYSQPIILQHFPLYRESDVGCVNKDFPINNDIFREKWEVLSKESTKLLGTLKPRLAFSGHIHSYCQIINKQLNIEEYTLASFNWRNGQSPSFLLTTITPNDYAVNKCNMPKEKTIKLLYIAGAVIIWFLHFSKFFINKMFKKRVHTKKTQN